MALALAYAIFNLWTDTRPDDPQSSAIIAGVVVFVASFIALFFLTKGSGD